VDESDAFCRFCGLAVSAIKPPSSEAVETTSASGAVGKAQEPTKRSGEATASLILGLFSFVPIVGLLAVIFGHLARASIRRSGGRLLGDGMAVFGLLLGYLGLGGWIVYGLTIVISPLLPSNLRRQNERLVVGDLRVINSAATTYASIYGHGYPPSLAALGPPKTGMKENAQAAGLIWEGLASGIVSRYRFTYAAGPKTSHVDIYTIDTYTVHADPVTPGEGGDNHYFTDESGVIRLGYDYKTGKVGEANADSPPITE
jgi:type II secretory pathway pseudopilin PulG